MTDNTQPEAREFTMSQYASKDDMIGAMRKRIAELESELEAVGAGGVQALSAAPAIGDELRDTLVAVSAAIAERDDRAAQKMICEILAASTTPPAEQQAQPGAVYAKRPRAGAIGYASVVDVDRYAIHMAIGPHLPGVRDIALWTTDQLRDFADRTHALRIEQAAPKAAPGEPSDVEIEKLAAEHLKAFAQFTGAGDVWVEGEVAFARAVLAKWGTPQQEAQEPVGVVEHAQAQTSYIHWTAAPPPNGAKLYTAPQQEAQEPVAISEAIERMAADRYKVVPSHESMFHRWAVVAGTGTQQLYLGREVECQNMARKFAGAFLDGAFVALQQAAPQPAPAPLSDDTKRLAWMADEWTPGHEKLYDKHVLETGGVGGLDDLRTFIDKQIAAQRGK